MKHEHWMALPEEHDYPAATDYLSLIFPQQLAESLTTAFKSSQVQMKKAKDLLRDSHVLLGEPSSAHVSCRSPPSGSVLNTK